MRRRNNVRPHLANLLEDDFKSLFQVASQSLAKSMINTVPAVNIKKTDNEFVLEMAVPGMRKEDFIIEVKENVLTVKSDLKNDAEDKKEGYLKQEFKYQSFARSFNMNNEVVDEESIKASYRDGILTITAAKKEEVDNGARSIQISE